MKKSGFFIVLVGVLEISCVELSKSSTTKEQNLNIHTRDFVLDNIDSVSITPDDGMRVRCGEFNWRTEDGKQECRILWCFSEGIDRRVGGPSTLYCWPVKSCLEGCTLQRTSYGPVCSCPVATEIKP